MDKYSKEELKARDSGDDRYLVFCMMVQVLSGCDQEFLEAKIEEYANY